MASEADVLNAVAAVLAENEVVGLSDNQKIAQKARMRWGVDLDAALRAHPWNFATRILPAAKTAAPPAAGFTTAYQRSADPYDLRVLKVVGQRKGDTWRVIGRQIHTNLAAPLKYEAIVRITDTQEWDALFTNYFASRVASRIAFSVTGLRTLSERVMKEADAELREAWSVDGQEDNMEDERIDRSGSILAGLDGGLHGDHCDWGDW